jgi:lactoylglutathione lyase
MTCFPLDHVSIMVRSLEASMPYYSTLLPLLGYHEKREGVWTDGAGFFFQFREAEPETRPYERFGPGMNHLGFAAPDRETVERIRSEMERAGFPVPKVASLGGAAALFMRDPDGIRFEITYYPEGVEAVA